MTSIIAVTILPAITLSLLVDVVTILLCCVALRFAPVKIAALLILVSTVFDLITGIDLFRNEVHYAFGIIVPEIIPWQPSIGVRAIFDSIGEIFHLFGVVSLLSIAIRYSASAGSETQLRQLPSQEFPT